MDGKIILVLLAIACLCFTMLGAYGKGVKKYNKSKPRATVKSQGTAVSTPRGPQGKSDTMPMIWDVLYVPVPPRNDFTIFDLETSGLDPKSCEILEIAAVRYRDGSPCETYHTYVRPKGQISASASAVNHLTWKDVCGAPTFDSVVGSFLNFIGDDVLVGYNVKFDIRFIETRSGKRLNNSAFDVLSFVKNSVYADSYTLDSMRQYFDVKGTVSHTALGDCYATGEVYQKCLQTPDGSMTAQKLADENRQREQIEAGRAAKYEKLSNERERIKVVLPPSSKIKSGEMQGKASAYSDIARDILRQNGIKDCAYKDYACDKLVVKDENGYIYGNHVIFGVNLGKRLRYVYLNYPPDKVSCNFPCTLTSQTEGMLSSRIFIDKPEDVNLLSEYILGAYKNTKQEIAQEREG